MRPATEEKQAFLARMQYHDGARLRAGVGAGGEGPGPRPEAETGMSIFRKIQVNHRKIVLFSLHYLLVRSSRQRSLNVVEADVQPPKTYMEREASS